MIHLIGNLYSVEVPSDAGETKICSVCKEKKSILCFGFRGKGSNVLKSGCKECYASKNNCDKSKTFIKNLDGETWKDIAGYEGFYQVSNSGRVKSLDRYMDRLDGKRGYRISKILKPQYNWKGYKSVTLKKNGTYKPMFAHRLVALHFIPNTENKPQVNHINGIKDDNRVENLEWCTAKENIQHYWKNPKTK